MGFIRRFTSDPGNAVLTNIEAVDIIDLDPPASPTGVGTGCVCIIGEFENGPFATPTEVSGATDLLNTFGGFGFTVNGVKGQNPCARKRTADSGSATSWNGNGYIQLAGKKFARLLIVRVDTSVGSVTITPGAAPTVDTTIPAGTLVSKAASPGASWVTMQDLVFPAGSTAALSVKVRPALDDGTATALTASQIDTISLPTGVTGYTVTNPSAVVAALAETAIDAAYQTCIDSTVDMNGVSHDINVLWSARQSTAIRTGLRANVLDASANGCLGRMAVIRPPRGTTKTVATQLTAPGVGATRDERVIYCYPHVQVYIPTIAAVGTAGGYGFSANGLTDVGSDGMMASILSQLPPEENPGQRTTFTSLILGLESSSTATGFKMADYVSLKAAGVASPRMDSGTMVFQSGVTSVDPSVYPNLKNIARRRMADFIQDTLALRLSAFNKKLNSFNRRKSVAAEIRTFMNSLLDPTNQRIAAYFLDEKSGNTPASQALGITRFILRVRTLSSMDAIVLQTEIGEGVSISELN